MRITNLVLQQSTQAHLQDTYRALAVTQGQISSGHRISVASDDPTAAGSVLRLRSARVATDQYQRNIETGTGRLSAEEHVLGQLTDTLDRARELAVGQGSDTSSAATRLTAKTEVDNLLQTSLDLGNTTYLDGYLFGGTAAQTAPFDLATVPYSSAPPSGTQKVEIAAGQFGLTNHDGTQVFLNTGMLKALQDLSTALGANDTVGIRTAEQSLRSSGDKVQALLGDVGARSAQMESARNTLGAVALDLDSHLSTLEDTDMTQATVDLMRRQTTLQAALLTTQKVLGISLADYLK